MRLPASILGTIPSLDIYSSRARITPRCGLWSAGRWSPAPNSEEAPGWPHLPLRREDIEAMVDDDCIRCSVVGISAVRCVGKLDAASTRPSVLLSAG